MEEDMQIVMKQKDILKKGDFETAFKRVLEIILRKEKSLEQAVAGLKQKFDEMSSQMMSSHDESLGSIKKQVDSVFVGERMDAMRKEHEQMMAEMHKKMMSVKDGKPGMKGMDADPKMAATMAKEMMKPDMYQMKDVVMGEIDKAITKNAEITKLHEFIKDLKEKVFKVTTAQASKGIGATNAVQYADLSSQCDGATRTFTVPRHRIVLGLNSTQFPIVYRPVTDFTTANLILTTSSALDPVAVGQTLIFTYVK